MSLIIKIVFALSLLSSIISAKEMDSAAVVESMIKAYGGEKNIKRLNSYEQTWHIETKVSDKNGTDNRKVDMPYFLRTELIYPDKTETRVLIKDYGIKEFNQERIQAQGPMLDAMKLQLMRLFNPMILKNMLKDITLHVEKDYYMLSLKKSAVTAEYYVSKKSFFVEKVVGRLMMGPQSMEFLTIYEDYKLVNGVMVHHKEIKYAGSVNTAVMRLKRMSFTEHPKMHH